MVSRLSLWLCAMLWFSSTTFSLAQQNPGNPPSALPCLSGIINHYTPVIGFGCDSSSLKVGTLSGFATGDKVLLLQMQVPQVDLSNTASFGTVLNTTCIGNYELNRIQSLGNGVIQLKFELTRSYDLSGKIQLVQVPEYDSAMVCGITCLPWDGTVGGVLALDVKNQLTLSGHLDVSGKGFRGGSVEMNSIPWVFGEQQFFYPPNTTLAAEKGEGIVAIPSDYSFGRGRAGNGGGGGNAHNGGGGGGANAGSGGNGGLEITSLPAAPTPNTDGIGGQKYFENQSSKILLGGGGGGGHANDMLGTPGGIGGGIVLLLANTIKTNNFNILANGQDVVGGQDHNDGQGGGGSGGTILLQVGQILGSLSCEAKGGRGGSNPYVFDFQLHGPGGGGGGGKILSTQNTPNLLPNLLGGANGLSSQGLSNGAQPGEAGMLISNFALPQGTAPTHPVSNQMQLAALSPLCAGQHTGQISILQSTALAFRLNGGAWQADSVFSLLAPGTYQIGLQFSGGCVLDTLVTLNAAPPLQDSLLMLSPASCHGGGAIVVEAISGTGPFEFQLNTEPWQSTGVFPNLPAGNYTITLRNAAGCMVSSNYTVPGLPSTTDTLLNLLHATCVMGGQIQVEAISGTPPYEFQVNNGPWQNSGLFADLSPGNYTLNLRDGAGCVLTEQYVIASPAQLSDSLIAWVDATCIQGGTISLAAISGTAPFEFQLNGGAWQTSGMFQDLSPGDYSIQLRDAAGCVLTEVYAIQAPLLLKDSLLLLRHASCIEGGTISLAAVSGAAPFEFQINGGAWLPNGLFSNLMPGSYTIQLRDAAGCIQAEAYTIDPPLPLQDSLLLFKAKNCLEDGEIVVAATSGTAPFEYQLNGGSWQGDGSFSGLQAGNYAITIRDAAGCTLTVHYSIQAPAPLIDSLLQLVHASCVKGGMIVVSAISGNAPVEFQLNGGMWQSGGAFSDLPAGNYTLALRDAAGCTRVGSYAILPPPPLTDTVLALVQPTCVAGGTLSIAAASGSAPVEFQLNGGAWQSSGTFLDLPPGNYTLTLRDAAACTQTGSFTLLQPPALILTVLDDNIASCLKGGDLLLAATSGTAPFEFQLDGGIWQSSGYFKDLAAGNHSVKLRDAAQCIAEGVFLIGSDPPLALRLDSLQVIDCRHALGYLAVSASGGKAAYTFSINNVLATSESGLFPALTPGVYSIKVSDSAGCETVLEGLEISSQIDSITTREKVVIYEGAYYQLPDGKKTAVSGAYPFMYETVDGCDSLHIIDLEVRKRHIYVPNVFLPEKDGPNRYFTVYADESLEVVRQLAVYDRWGELVYLKENLAPNDEENGWNGFFRDRLVNPGVFVWTADLKFKDGLALKISGNVTIVQ